MTLSRWQDESEGLLRVVERIALILNEAGIPRMPARVLAFMLADDADRYSAAALAEGLRVSPAAISAAVRYLTARRILVKEREPGKGRALLCQRRRRRRRRLRHDRVRLDPGSQAVGVRAGVRHGRARDAQRWRPPISRSGNVHRIPAQRAGGNTGALAECAGRLCVGAVAQSHQLAGGPVT